MRGDEEEFLREPRPGMSEHKSTGVIVLGSILPYKDPHSAPICCSMLGDTGCECMVVIGQELVPLFLREAATVPFNLMGVGQAHLDGGKQVVRGDILVPVSRDGVVMARCRDATIYIANVGPRCILGFPFFARYGIHINIEPPCFMFEEDVGKANISAGLTAGVTAPAPHLQVQSREVNKPSIESSAKYIATHDAIFEVQNTGSDSVGHHTCFSGATADAVHPVSQVALHSPDADVLSDPPMVLEIPQHQVSPSPSSPAHVFPVLSSMLALCTSSAALHLADQSKKHSDHRIPRAKHGPPGLSFAFTPYTQMVLPLIVVPRFNCL